MTRRAAAPPGHDTRAPALAPPPDWPETGPIDPGIHDLPHRSASIESWCLSAHLGAADGHELSLFAAFFRRRTREGEGGRGPFLAHALTWAISDSGGHRYYPYSRLESSATLIWTGLAGVGRPGLAERALDEQLRRGAIPSPDLPLAGNVRVTTDRLNLSYGADRLVRRGDGSYRLVLLGPNGDGGCKLSFTPGKVPVPHGDRGNTPGLLADSLFSYSITRLDVCGTVRLEGKPMAVRGSGWYDHHFGESTGPAACACAWNRAAVQLDDGSELSVLSLVDTASGRPVRTWGCVVEPDGRVTWCPNASLEPASTGWWRSTRSFHAYPTSWRVALPSAVLELELEVEFPEQEFLTLIAPTGFWKGRLRARGHRGERRLTGLAWVERGGFAPLRSMDDLLQAVRQEVQAQLASVLPLKPARQQVVELVGSGARPEYADNLDPEQYARTVLRPLREIADRGGKAWRSFGVLACIDAVGGDSGRFRRWLALPEIIHVGSLILDDIEDGSEIRRGGPAAHRIFGQPLALNAGCAAYFLAEYPMMSVDLAPEAKLRVYGHYFEALRAGHAGQAFDLDGMADLVRSAVERRHVGPLEQRIRATYLLKTGAAAGAVARMGAVAGGGSAAQVEALGGYFEALGVAFQIIDDVLDVRGFAGERRPRCEDLRAGKVTLVIARAFSLLDPSDRMWLWGALRSRPANDSVVAEMVERLEACGAVRACVREAAGTVETAWQRGEQAIPDSFSKILLRALGWYVLERAY